MQISRILKLHKELDRKLSFYRPALDSRYAEEAELYKSSLHEFAKGAWHINEGGRPFVDGWHLHAVSEHLEALYRGEIQNLLINVPPRTCKSTMVSVLFPAWCWINEPELQFLYISYVSRLSIKDSVKCRRVLTSQWYQDRFKHLFQLEGDVNSKIRFDNDKSGYRIATSVGGAGTGDGGDIIVLDDPNNAGETESDVKRAATNDWCDFALSSRLNDLKTGRFIAVQQRLHMEDFSGHILEQKIPGMVHLCLPMEYESRRKCITIPLKSTNGQVWKDPREKEGALLWPERIGQKELAILKKKMGHEYIIAGQLQQLPAPAEGGLIKKAWFQWWKEAAPPPCEFVIQSWDTAFSDSSDACFSCCTNWGVFRDRYDVSQVILLSMWHGKLTHPDLRRLMIRMANNYRDNNFNKPLPEDYVLKPDMILVEAGANGVPLVQELRRAGLVINKFDPRKAGGETNNSKFQRTWMITHMIEAGKVWMPAQPDSFETLRPFADFFVNACAMWPNDKSNDIVDSMSQALNKLEKSMLINNPNDPQYTQPYNSHRTEKFY